MSLSIERRGVAVRLTLDGEPSVADVREMHAQLVAVLDARCDVVLDLASVRRADTAVLQLLHAVALFVASLRVVGASESWSDAVRLLGLGGTLGVDPGR